MTICDNSYPVLVEKLCDLSGRLNISLGKDSCESR
jgi:hypothetical protein